MSDSLYDGPIIDAHHHLWDLRLDRHPWLRPADGGIQALGDLGPLRQNYLVDDYLRDVAGQNVVASVHIEALWDRSRDPLEETLWLDTLDKSAGVASRYVAYTPLGDAHVEQKIEAQKATGMVVGIRNDFRWHVDSRKRFIDRNDVLDDDGVSLGVAALARHQLILEALVYPGQATRLAKLAHRFPDAQLVVNHCGSPVDSDELDLWRAGLIALARQPNIAIKVSDIGAYFPHPSAARVADLTLTCIDAFGVERVTFASDLPVAKLNADGAGLFPALKQAVRGFSPADQKRMFHDNANALYQLGLSTA
jgi:predicted TIM-barrel fold metal-dependent hydrolase